MIFGLFKKSTPQIDMAKLTQSIYSHEGLRLKPYTDTTGNLTIGYGTNLADGITQEEAAYLCSNRIALALNDAQGEPWWANVKDNDVRARALVEIVYNMGLEKVREFKKALTALEANDFETASDEFKDSLWDKQVGNRAVLLTAMIATGED